MASLRREITAKYEESDNRMGNNIVRYKTPSPYIDVDHVELPPMLFMRSKNFWQRHLDKGKDYCNRATSLAYLKEQGAILRYNNKEWIQHLDLFRLLDKMKLWEYNECVLKCTTIEDITDTVNLIFNLPGDAYLDLIDDGEKDMKTHWYGDNIERSGLRGSEKTAMKNKLINESKAIAKREMIKDASDEYRDYHYNAFPTVGDLEKKLTDRVTGLKTMSYPTIKKHGEGYYVGTVQNREQLVFGYKLLYPNATQQEVADALRMGRTTITSTLWKEVNEFVQLSIMAPTKENADTAADNGTGYFSH